MRLCHLLESLGANSRACSGSQTLCLSTGSNANTLMQHQQASTSNICITSVFCPSTITDRGGGGGEERVRGREGGRVGGGGRLMRRGGNKGDVPCPYFAPA